MNAVQEKKQLSPQEYLQQERQALEKSEYYQGECFAMAGASREHNTLTLNLAALLRESLRGQPCQPYMADLKLQIEAHTHYVYPDVMVVCGENAYVEKDLVNDATMIAEMLSPSTEQYDRGMKFLHYQSLPSFQEYVLVSQDQLQVEVFHRTGVSDWTYQVLSHSNEKLRLTSLNFSCTLSELYESLPFAVTKKG